MYSYHAERLVPGEPSAVRAAIAELIDGLWGDRRRTLFDDQANERTDAIAAEASSDEPDVWLTWELARMPNGTRVRLRLDELDRGPNPTADLGELLDTLASRVPGPTVTETERDPEL